MPKEKSMLKERKRGREERSVRTSYLLNDKQEMAYVRIIMFGYLLKIRNFYKKPPDLHLSNNELVNCLSAF